MKGIWKGKVKQWRFVLESSDKKRKMFHNIEITY